MFETVRLVAVAEIQEMLSGDIADGFVEEYYRFGSFVVSELQSVGNQIEGKLTALLGLATGMVVFLLFGTSVKACAPSKVWINLAGAIALCALLVSVAGLLSRLWRLPSESDWFKLEIKDPLMLKKYHVVSLLAAHQQHLKLTIFKSDCLRVAELLMALSALVVGLSIVIS
jgi:hypothetical protein